MIGATCQTTNQLRRLSRVTKSPCLSAAMSCAISRRSPRAASPTASPTGRPSPRRTDGSPLSQLPADGSDDEREHHYDAEQQHGAIQQHEGEDQELHQVLRSALV